MTGWLLRDYGDPQKAFGIMGLSDATIESKWLFQFSFCAVSLAIVWGTTLERIKFGVYVIYAVVFAALIYPIASHWVFGGGWLQSNVGMQDFAGSTAVHLIGATGALAVLLLLGARRGRYGPDGKPRAIPGHNMPLFGLGVLILWLGWFGFNPGSTLNALDGRFPQVAIVTLLAAAAGVVGALLTAYRKTGFVDIGMAGNGAIGALVAITAPSGYVEPWAADPDRLHRRRHRAARRVRDRQEARRSGRRAHGTRPVRCVGHALVRHLHRRRAWPSSTRSASRRPALLRLASTSSAARCSASWSSFAFVFAISYGVFWAIKKTYGLRVSAEEEDAGLDISEHGMYGYPEQFIPAPELVGYTVTPGNFAREPRMPASTPATEVPA